MLADSSSTQNFSKWRKLSFIVKVVHQVIYLIHNQKFCLYIVLVYLFFGKSLHFFLKVVCQFQLKVHINSQNTFDWWAVSLVIAARKDIEPSSWRTGDDLLRNWLGQRDLQFSGLNNQECHKLMMQVTYQNRYLTVGSRYRHPVCVPHNPRVRWVQVIMQHHLLRIGEPWWIHDKHCTMCTLDSFFSLSTESGGTHCPTSRLSYHWTYICPNALGQKEYWEK